MKKAMSLLTATAMAQPPCWQESAAEAPQARPQPLLIRPSPKPAKTVAEPAADALVAEEGKVLEHLVLETMNSSPACSIQREGCELQFWGNPGHAQYSHPL